MRDNLEWRIETHGDTAVVTLTGTVTERAALEPLVGELASAGKVQFDLGEIRRLNSSGVREWVEFMRALPATVEARFDNCSTAVVHQINLIHGFTGRAKVCSIRVPFVCDGCGLEESTTLPVEHGVMPSLGDRTCKKCGRPMELDDIAESYFAFLLR